MCCVRIYEQRATFGLYSISRLVLYVQPSWELFTARYALIPYIKETRFFFKWLLDQMFSVSIITIVGKSYGKTVYVRV